MSDTHDVISAFLDDEPFDSSQLAEALSERAGRDLLLDLLALRHLVQPQGNEVTAPFEQQPRRSALQALVAIAAILVALAGGYLVGQRRGGTALSEAPPATRVVEAPAAWQEVPPGRMR
jgi:hypothetical protein